jgi:small-conductance mechanosensitive channel
MTSSVHHEASDVSVPGVLGFGVGLAVSGLVISILVAVAATANRPARRSARAS